MNTTDRLIGMVQSPLFVIPVLLIMLGGAFKVGLLDQAILVQRFVGPAAIITVLPEPEPNASEACLSSGGICVPVGQPPPFGMIDYGACTELYKCVVKDLCESSGGVVAFPYDVGKNTYFKSCSCPFGTAYELVKGCAQQFGTPVVHKGGGGGY